MTSDCADTTPVRPDEQLDWLRLSAWLRTRLASCGIAGLDLSREMRPAQFPGGHSNLTYLLRFGDTDFVLRRPPFGPVPPTAHDMAREYRWLTALHPVFPLAPRAYVFCDDASVIGSVFYVMERRRGIVVRHEEPPALAGRPDARGRVSAALVLTRSPICTRSMSRQVACRASANRPASSSGRCVDGLSVGTDRESRMCQRWTRSPPGCEAGFHPILLFRRLCTATSSSTTSCSTPLTWDDWSRFWTGR